MFHTFKLFPVNGEVYSIKFVSRYSGSVSSTKKTDRRDITEILLKVALNTITLIIPPLNYKNVLNCLYTAKVQHLFHV